jgi:competence ComEA-like helix-hairpin-helix protein
LRAAQSLAFLVGTATCLVLSLSFAAGVLQRPETGTAFSTGERVNPNEAPVASLRRLPQIGAARARAIVAHRRRVGTETGGPPAFKTADDLRQIRGIGPAIVEDIRPWLQFDDPPKDADAPPTE